jgi:pimeloyl-ACP methyl ester carboxylesterase
MLGVALSKLTSEVEMTTRLQSEQIEERLSRRGLVQALAAGAAATSVATPSLAQPTSALAEATFADYLRDPTHWGSAEVAALFPGFRHLDIRTKGAVIRLRHGGSGSPLLLLHGNSQNHATWFGVAARLAERYHVVLADLRGYGDSSLPDPGLNHINYSAPALAEDMFEVMDSLGHQRFFLAGHDRGARVSHRMCLDHPDRIMKVCIVDVLPASYVWTNLNIKSALNSWHWLFLAQPEPLPDTLISAVSAEWFLKSRGYEGSFPRSCSTTISGASQKRRSSAPAATIAQMPRSISRLTWPRKIARWRRRSWCCGVREARRRPRNILRYGAGSRAIWSTPNRSRPATPCK